MLKKVFLIILTAGFLYCPLAAQQVTRLEGKNRDLKTEMELTFQKGKEFKDFWIGYSISSNDDYQICYGECHIDDDYNEITLRDLIYNTEKFKNYKSKPVSKLIRGVSMRIIHGRYRSDKKGDPETALLFRYDKNSTGINDFAEINICNLAYFIEFDEAPLLWLGLKENEKSLQFLTAMYESASFPFVKKELIPAAGIHTSQTATTLFLKNVFNSKEKIEVRERSIFWLGQQNNYDAFETLKSIAWEDDDYELREEAIMGLGQIKLPEATDELIKLAKQSRDGELREKAIFWLGQKAVDKAKTALKDFVENDPDIEIKKRAIFALSQNMDDELPYLIKLAKTNPSLEIRKHAIWALGNTDDERAVDALIEILNK